MDSTMFEYLIALDEEGSYPKAAARVFITPQGLSNAMRRLEKDYGVPLVVPDGHGVSLTPYGSIVVKHFRRISEEMDAARQEVDQLLQTESAELRLIASIGLINYFPPDIIEKYTLENKFHTQLLFLGAASDFECEDVLAKGECDFALVVDPSDKSRFVSIPLYHDMMFAWVDESSDYAKRGEMCLNDMVGQSVVHLSGEGFRQGQIFSEVLGDKINDINVIYVDEMIEVLRRAVVDNCIALTARPHVEAITVKGLKGIPVTDLTWGFSLIYSRDRILSPSDEAFIAAMESYKQFF